MISPCPPYYSSALSCLLLSDIEKLGCGCHTRAPKPISVSCVCRGAEARMHDARTSAGSGLTLDRSSCSAVLARPLLGCLKAFLLGWRAVLLSTSWSGVKWLDNKDEKWQEPYSAEEEEGYRMCAYGRDGVKRRQLWRSLQLRRFWQLLQPGIFSLETMYFKLLFEVLALAFRSTCKTGGHC